MLGPPGTGKTTYLLNQLDKVLGQFTPSSIGFISFTKKAANEARERAMSRFDLCDEELPYFSTMHSLAFRELRLKRGDVLNARDYFEIAKRAGVSIGFEAFDEFGRPQGYQRGNALLDVVSAAKIRKISAEESWQKFGDDQITLEEVHDFDSIIRDYKIEKSKVDFDDMIINFTSRGIAPFIQALFVDESQDLSSIQWDMARLLGSRTQVNYVAGDDDQAIFEWAGADVNQFIDLEGKVQTLNRSWRVPVSVKELSQGIVDKISKRREKDWLPADSSKIGKVEFISSLDEVLPSISEGTWLLLARTNGMLPPYESLCQEAGVFYRYAHKSKDFKDIILAVRDWIKLREGKIITANRAKNIYALMSNAEGVRHGSKKKLNEIGDKEILDIEKLKEEYGLMYYDKDWPEALERISDEDRLYIEKAIKTDDISLPRVTISTIHGAKGGEAENVVLMSDMGYKAFSAMAFSPDMEHRTWYVGVTRTKMNLFILEPETQYSYEF